MTSRLSSDCQSPPSRGRCRTCSSRRQPSSRWWPWTTRFIRACCTQPASTSCARGCRAESALESLSRLRFLQRGLLPTAIQPVIRSHGRFVARADFGFGNRAGVPTVLGEADGRSAHNQPGMRLQDSRREERLRLLGFEVVRWDWAELAQDPDAIVARIRAFLALADRVA